MTWKSMGLTSLVVVGVSVLGAPPLAHACSAPPSGCHERIDLFPELTARPTNACIFVRLEIVRELGPSDAGPLACGTDGGANDFVYVAPDGTTIGLSPGELRCPERPLESFTEYRVIGPSDCGRGVPHEVGRFTTGAGPDLTAPPAPGEVTQTCWADACDDDACCGPFTIAITSSAWTPVTDESGVVLYATSSGIQREARVVNFEETSGHVMFDPFDSFASGRVHRGSFGAVVAYDVAGNHSVPATPTSGCAAETESDAGIIPVDVAGFDARVEPDDARTVDAAPTEQHDESCGTESPTSCAAHTQSPRAAPRSITSLLLVMLVVLARRR